MFNSNDIEEQLLYGGSNQSGAYDHLRWSIYPGSDFTDIVDQIISVHESFHNELNNITGYGFMLIGYAYLSREESAKKKYYKKMLGSLVSRCKIAHEAYATWLGFAVFKKFPDNDLHLKVLDNNEEYLGYYNKAEHLVKNLKSIYVKQHVVLAAIRFCFQSKKLAEYGINNLDNFKVDAIDEEEFPDSRFRYLSENLPERFFSDCVVEFINDLAIPYEQFLLSEAWNGRENVSELLKKEHNHLSVALMNRVYTKLSTHVEQLDSPSLAYEEEHLHYFKELCKQLNALCPFENAKNPMYLNDRPDDQERSILMNFENETVMLSPFPLPCVIRKPEEIDESQHKWLLSGISSQPHLFIMARYSIFLENQYRFENKEDKIWFEKLNGPFTFIRYAQVVDGNRIIYMIPFENPEQLINFLDHKPENVPIFACVSVSVLFHNDWWQQWRKFFEEDCRYSCLLTDVSPIYFIERIFPNEKSVFYTKLAITTEGITYTAILFQVIEAGQIKALMLAPCSEMYSRALRSYIESKGLSISYINALEPDIGKYIPVILAHIVREEHIYYFRSQNLNFFKFSGQNDMV